MERKVPWEHGITTNMKNNLISSIIFLAGFLLILIAYINRKTVISPTFTFLFMALMLGMAVQRLVLYLRARKGEKEC